MAMGKLVLRGGAHLADHHYLYTRFAINPKWSAQFREFSRRWQGRGSVGWGWTRMGVQPVQQNVRPVLQVGSERVFR